LKPFYDADLKTLSAYVIALVEAASSEPSREEMVAELVDFLADETERFVGSLIKFVRDLQRGGGSSSSGT
jgi:hypothetical protein